ncbi:MATE family efflux transporter [Paenibacillus crassostreae]|uniref:Probable multidrug resistance protein NorM n=1 Tax=Paenibacillus crassostreae TaxID=1763538 RepID=A0A167DTV7_9BACL|nr:MATE family efflux transporter [Paenibacillus crassostreae]AOZ91070.1 MATE family efflux transporter [Paenibacillus crassostreae]OAB74769.1 MATE family efflux transporter [Paenibacillus crassostreae]
MINTLFQSFREDKPFLKTFVLLALPIGLQSMVMNVTHTIASLMVGQLGDLEVSATSLAGQIFFILNLIIVGIVSGATIFLAQYFGKGDHKQLKVSIALGFILIIAVSILFSVVSLAFPASILQIFSTEKELIELASNYLKIVCISYIPTGITLAVSMVFRNIGQAKLPLKITIMGIFINVGLSTSLIFGNFGFPELGIYGAAVSIVITKFIEMILFVWFLYRKFSDYAPLLTDLLGINRSFLKTFFKTSLPVIINEAFWSIGIALYSIVFYKMGYTIGAAVGIAKVLEQLLISFFIGAGHAGAIILGQAIGEGKRDEAPELAKKMGLYTGVGGIGISFMLLIGTPLYLTLYQGISTDVKDAIITIMIYLAFILPLKGMNFIHIMGTLRAGGDTFMCMIIDNFSLWCVSIPLTFLFGYFLDFGIEIVYLFVVIDDICKFLLIQWRIRGRKWIHNLI